MLVPSLDCSLKGPDSSSVIRGPELSLWDFSKQNFQKGLYGTLNLINTLTKFKM